MHGIPGNNRLTGLCCPTRALARSRPAHTWLDAATITETLKRGLQQLLSPRNEASAGEIERLTNALVVVAPAAAAMITMTTLTLNLWLAAKITATSARLNRPWPDLKNVALPPMTLAALCVAIGLSFTGGMLAILSIVVAVALMMAYALTGFAALHTLTLALKSRALWLGITYAIVVLFVWPVVAMVVLGVADAIFGLRQRFLQGRPPPLPSS